MKMALISYILSSVLHISFILYTLFSLVHCQLIVNVKNKGGDVEREKIEANTTTDTVILEFLSKDGSRVTQFIDFKADLQVFRVYVPWEEERGLVQSSPQVLCFITRFGKNEFISADAMSKLRQKNPTAIRVPEEDKGVLTHVLDMQVQLEHGSALSHHLRNFCHEAVNATHAKEQDIKDISQVLNRDLATLMSAVKKTDPESYTRCKDVTDISKPCLCGYQLCIGWYPCGLKYCRGRDTTGKVVNYRCGIKTCRRCLMFEYFAHQKMYCLWDDL